MPTVDILLGLAPLDLAPDERKPAYIKVVHGLLS
jgi:hypothetical protein